MIALIFAAMAAISQHQTWVYAPNHTVAVYAVEHGYRCAALPSTVADHHVGTHYRCHFTPRLPR